MHGARRKKIQQEILAWYKKNKRDLPWRNTHDPYKILVSEIMLQQTQVPRVIEKYHSFLKRFPTVESLAQARTASVITEWKGLGYNRRALYLQKGAQAVVATYNGRYPNTLDELKALPGIGDYTARALLSFAYKKQVPMMDTNHRKFYSRIFPDAKTDTELLDRAEELLVGLTKKQVYNWNQGLMDFMSAIGRGEKDSTIRWFHTVYPAQEYKKEKKKNTVPFRQTDRYLRGKIVDSLREEKKLSLKKIKTMLNVEADRFERVIHTLKGDGLIKQVGKSIMLP